MRSKRPPVFSAWNLWISHECGRPIIDRAIFVRRPADEREDRARHKARNTAAAVDNPVASLPTEAQPMFLDAFLPEQFDMGEMITG